jgi:hypothetical protein
MDLFLVIKSKSEITDINKLILFKFKSNYVSDEGFNNYRQPHRIAKIKQRIIE